MTCNLYQFIIAKMSYIDSPFSNFMRNYDDDYDDRYDDEDERENDDPQDESDEGIVPFVRALG